MSLLRGADRTVRSLLPEALEAGGLPRQAERLRGLPELRDAGSVSMACGTMRRVRALLLRRPELEEAVRLCEEASVAALSGDHRGFGGYVRRAAAQLRLGSAPPVLS
jgi:hypothetical protein